MTLGQRIELSGFNFYFLRIITAFGLLRLVLRRDYRSVRVTQLDKAIIVWVSAAVLVGVFRGELESMLGLVLHELWIVVPLSSFHSRLEGSRDCFHRRRWPDDCGRLLHVH